VLNLKSFIFDQALKALEAYGKIPIMFFDVELEVSLRIAGERGIYAYDAYILRCAQKHLSPLVSLDRYLVDYAEGMGNAIQCAVPTPIVLCALKSISWGKVWIPASAGMTN
jgi:hypothetical protein